MHPKQINDEIKITSLLLELREVTAKLIPFFSLMESFMMEIANENLQLAKEGKTSPDTGIKMSLKEAEMGILRFKAIIEFIRTIKDSDEKILNKDANEKIKVEQMKKVDEMLGL